MIHFFFKFSEFISETLRKYSVLPSINRSCSKDYRIPGTNAILEKGTSIFIPVFALQRDERFYPEPETFDPSRFSDANKSGKSFADMPYLPFGDGPRKCIGIRMGKLSTKVALVSILEKYCVSLGVSSLGDQHVGKNMEFSKTSIILTPAAGIYLKLTKRHMQTEL